MHDISIRFHRNSKTGRISFAMEGQFFGVSGCWPFALESVGGDGNCETFQVSCCNRDSLEKYKHVMESAQNLKDMLGRSCKNNKYM